MIHTVGPVYSGGNKGEADLLQNAYGNSLKLAREKGLQSISFPAISCGVYGYPVEEAARLAMKICIEFARENPEIKLIRHILFNRKIYDVFSAELAKMVL